MGVKDLWTILTPICERKPIWELQDKTIAIDLSAWICDSSTVAEHCSQKNMYLRNLFFRTSYLLLLGVKPIFVLEGKAPVLKHDTIEKRQQAQGRSAGRNVKAGSRARLKGLQTQCAALLSAMGLKCIQGDGEAEAYCALLNQAGLVDGVVTQDSDVFLYGGVKVYRHFNTSSAGGGSVDTYEMDKIHTKLGLGRYKLIALSLLCGCDYNKGVNGVGKESALKFFQSVPDEEILDRIQKWRQNSRLDKIDLKKDKTISAELKCELQIRAKALQDETFPCQEVLDEFLQINSKELPQVRFEWNKPNISQFLKLSDVKLAWDSTYALEKALPLLTRWHLTHNDSSLTPELILNAKTTRGIKGYVVKWEEFEVTTEEPQALFEDKYPLVVQTFVESKTKGKKRATKKNKENENPATTYIAASQTEPSEEFTKNKTTTKSRSKKIKNGTTEGTMDILDEIHEESNDGLNMCNENEVSRVDKINKTKYGIDKENNNKSNENQTTNNTKKPERKKKEPVRQKKVTAENTKKKTDNKLCENNRDNNVDIRSYFKPDVDKPSLANVSREMFDNSMNLLDTSMNSLSIRTEHVGKPGKVGDIKQAKIKDKVKSDKACGMKDLDREAGDIEKVKTKDKLKSDKDLDERCGMKDLDISPVVRQDIGSKVKKDIGRCKRNIQISLSDHLDSSINDSFPIYNSVSSDDIVEKRNLKSIKQSQSDIGKENKNKHEADIDLNDVDDILDFSFETACRIMSQKNKELGLNQFIANERPDNELGLNQFIANESPDNKLCLNQFIANESPDNKLGINEFSTNERPADNNISRYEIIDKFKVIDKSENRIKDVDQFDIIEDIDKSEVISEVCNASKMGNSRENIPNAEGEMSSSRENQPQYLDMTDFIMSINESEVNINESFDKNEAKNSLLESKTLGNVNQLTRIDDNVDLVTENISYMSFTEDNISSPCRINIGTHKNYIKEGSQRIISNIGVLTTSSQSSPDKSSQRKHHPIDYTKFTPNENCTWNTSSPLMRYNPRPSFPRVNPARVSNSPNCQSPLRVKYQSHTEGLNVESSLRVKTNLIKLDENSPVLHRDHSISPKVRSISRQLNSSPMRGVSQGSAVSFDMDDFEFDEGIEDLSGIIDNIIGQK